LARVGVPDSAPRASHIKLGPNQDRGKGDGGWGAGLPDMTGATLASLLNMLPIPEKKPLTASPRALIAASSAACRSRAASALEGVASSACILASSAALGAVAGHGPSGLRGPLATALKM